MGGNQRKLIDEVLLCLYFYKPLSQRVKDGYEVNCVMEEYVKSTLLGRNIVIPLTDIVYELRYESAYVKLAHISFT